MNTRKYDPPPARDGTHSYSIGGKIIQIKRLESSILHVTYPDHPEMSKTLIQKGKLFYLTGSGENAARLEWDDILDTL